MFFLCDCHFFDFIEKSEIHHVTTTVNRTIKRDNTTIVQVIADSYSFVMHDSLPQSLRRCVMVDSFHDK